MRLVEGKGVDKQIILVERIGQTILELRSQKVIIDADLAAVYGTTTKRLNQAVRRNQERFPDDFMFQLTEEEKIDVVTNCDHLTNLKFSPNLPFAFTEHGALMAASVLNTVKAVRVSVFVVRVFVKLRAMIANHKELAVKLKELERIVGAQDQAIIELVQTIKQLMEPSQPKPKQRIGF